MGASRELAELGGAYNSGGLFAFRNRIINGDMRIDQRNNGASVTLTASNVYNLDRWYARAATGSGHTAVRSTTATTGFINSLLVTIGTGASPGATDNNYIAQRIEGLNVSDLGWGTASAATVTLSFVVRSSVTGTFGGAIQNSDLTRSYPFTYTVSAANTFETKTVTIPGDTSGTWLTTNGIGATLTFDLGTGATYQGTAGVWATGDYRAAAGTTKLVATSGATFYITGVQLEKGSTATSFDYRDYGRELQMCQRYYWKVQSAGAATSITIGSSGNTTTANFDLKAPVALRSSPTITFSGLAMDDAGSVSAVSSVGVSGGFTATDIIPFFATGSATLTAGRASILRTTASTTSYIDFSAEL